MAEDWQLAFFIADHSDWIMRGHVIQIKSVRLNSGHFLGTIEKQRKSFSLGFLVMDLMNVWLC